MKHLDFLDVIEEKVVLIKEENVLFWNLWCLNYLFDKLVSSNDESSLLINLKSVNQLLWDFYLKKIDLNEVLKSKSVKYIIEQSEEEFDELDEDELEDKLVYEVFIALESILLNLNEEGKIIYRHSFENVMNYIDVEIDGIIISKDNTNKIYLNEVNSQLKLADVLSSQTQFYGFEDRNIFRN